MNFTVSEQILSGSDLTTSVIDCRDAFDLSVSLRTSAGTTAEWTYEVSNWTGRSGRDGDPPEASFSAWTTFSPSSATVINPVLGVRYARLVRGGATGTFLVEYSKQVR